MTIIVHLIRDTKTLKLELALWDFSVDFLRKSRWSQEIFILFGTRQRLNLEYKGHILYIFNVAVVFNKRLLVSKKLIIIGLRAWINLGLFTL